MSTYREMTIDELGGFQGCEYDPNGQLPECIEHEDRDGTHVILITDDRTTQVHFWPVGEAPTTYELVACDRLPRDAQMAIGWALMNSGLDRADLHRYGFTQIC